MDLIFDLGNSKKPKGHALVYFRDHLDSEKVYATYLVVFPLPVNIAKYIPPFLASSLGSASLSDISSFPMPPVPEEVESHSRLMRLAQSRDDDLIYGGTMSGSDVASSMHAIGEIAQRYTDMWTEFDQSQVPAITEASEEGIGVSEVMYSLLSEKDRLNELSKLLAKFRFSVEGMDRQLQKETEDEIKTLGRYLPEHFRIDRLIEVAKDASEKGTRLAQLYMSRCYVLSEGKGDEVEHLEQEITALEASG